MRHYVKSVGLALALSASAMAATKNVDSDSFYKTYQFPTMHEAQFDDPEYIEMKKEWTKQNRKVASAMSFNESDMSKDFRTLRDKWLQVSKASQMESLLKESKANYNSYSPDTKYFLAQMHLALPLRGIVWRMRKLFENNRKFLGNKSSHVAAIQLVRGAVTGLSTFLPTKQTDAGIEFFTEPSAEMKNSDQFQSIAQFQQFIMQTLIPSMNDSIGKLLVLRKELKNENVIWDNKIVFGSATFEDELSRFIGHGPAEFNFVIATLYKAEHDLFVYCAFNQDHSIKVAGEIGAQFGIDSGSFSGDSSDLGITDKEKTGILRRAVASHHFLELRNDGNSGYGAKVLKEAYKALKNSVVFYERTYDYLQTKDGSQAMALNPVLFQPEIKKNFDKGIANMKAVVSGPAEVRDPVTGKTVSINLPAFYSQPPKSLGALMANGFEGGASEKNLTNKHGETLTVRNYFSGRAISWDNNAWKTYVPSAAGQSGKYMSEAARIIRYSFGTAMVFKLPSIFVY